MFDEGKIVVVAAFAHKVGGQFAGSLARAALVIAARLYGSDHDWLEGRVPRCSLLIYIDDATRELMHLEMAESESAFPYMLATTAYLKRHGAAALDRIYAAN